MNILYIILKHVVWRFRIYNYFREISKFRDFMNTLRNFAKSVFAQISHFGEYRGDDDCYSIYFDSSTIVRLSGLL